MRVSEADELSRVMGEVSEAMGAESTILTSHPENGPGGTLFAGSLHETIVGVIFSELPRHEQLLDGEHAWFRVGTEEAGYTVLAMPVQKVEGHSMLVLSAIFSRLDEEQQIAAEQVYLRRRPFAVGYFRLWQLDRTRARRIAALEAALDTTELGVILLDREERLAFVNHSAKLILDEGNGLRRARNGLVAASLKDAVRLRAAIEHVVDADSEGGLAPVLKVARRGKDPLIISVVPVKNPAIEPSDVAAIVYVLDPALDSERLLKPVCKLYELTPVETKLACLLTRGATLVEAAASLRVKEPTVKSCLKQVFLKTGVNRQTDLVRLLLNNLVRIRPDIRAEAV